METSAVVEPAAVNTGTTVVTLKMTVVLMTVVTGTDSVMDSASDSAN